MALYKDRELRAIGKQARVDPQMWCSRIHVWHLFPLHTALLIFLTTRSMMTFLTEATNFFKIQMTGVGEVRNRPQKTTLIPQWYLSRLTQLIITFGSLYLVTVCQQTAPATLILNCLLYTSPSPRDS